MVDWFSTSIFWRSLIAAILIGIMGAVVGVFILLRGLVFFGEAVAHSSFAGAGLAILLGIPPLGPILLFGVGSAIGIQYINEKRLMRDEVSLGIFFTATMALAIIFIGLAGEYNNIAGTLFGDILSLSVEDFVPLIFVTALVILVVIAVKKELHYITFNPDMAKISGIPVRKINYLFVILTALVITVALQAIGAILVFAMLVIPPAAAFQWTFKINKLILIAIIFSIISTISGLFISFIADFGSGASMVLTATIIFVISFISSPKRRARATLPQSCQFCKKFVTHQELEACNTCNISLLQHVHADGEIHLLEDYVKLQEIIKEFPEKKTE
ncbi:MAG: metal ABC transporter permease [Candidatus Helarchaeota archaeon]